MNKFFATILSKRKKGLQESHPEVHKLQKYFSDVMLGRKVELIRLSSLDLFEKPKSEIMQLREELNEIRQRLTTLESKILVKVVNEGNQKNL